MYFTWDLFCPWRPAFDPVAAVTEPRPTLVKGFRAKDEVVHVGVDSHPRPDLVPEAELAEAGVGLGFSRTESVHSAAVVGQLGEDLVGRHAGDRAHVPRGSGPGRGNPGRCQQEAGAEETHLVKAERTGEKGIHECECDAV